MSAFKIDTILKIKNTKQKQKQNKTTFPKKSYLYLVLIFFLYNFLLKQHIFLKKTNSQEKS
jgi:hypothetical protein